MDLNLDGGLIWLDFHIHKGIQTRAYYYKIENDIILDDLEWKIVGHYAIPMGHTQMSQSIHLFQINEDLFGFSLYQETQEINEINAVSLMWIGSKIFNPFKLLPCLKAIINSFEQINPYINNDTLKYIVQNIIQGRGRLDYMLEEGGQQIKLESKDYPENMTIPIKFII